uniref:Uncharacterized protein n=1 Tax=Tetradesmus obliquus TaxID=3088 RepID=A0A383WLD1_TETOB
MICNIRISAPATAAPRAAVLLRPSAVSRRVAVRATSPAGPADANKEEHKQGLISVWEDKELEQAEAASKQQEKHSLVSVWEDHEMKEEAKPEPHPDSLLNHPTGQKPKGSSYDSEW